MGYRKFISRLEFRRENAGILLLLFIAVIALMGNLNALIDHFLHPEIPYFDIEHLIVGSATAIAAALLFAGAVFYINLLNKAMAERKRAEDAVIKERDRAQQYLDTAGVIFVAIDSEQRISMINKKGCEILAYCEEDIIGKNWFDNFVPERVREDVRTLFNKLLAGEVVPAEHYENPVLAKNGNEKVILWKNSLIKDEDGKVLAVLSSGEDITERKKAETFIKDILESVDEGFLVIDREYRIISANKAYLEAVKEPLESVIGRHCYEISHHISKPCHSVGEQCPVNFTFNSGESSAGLHTHYDKEGNTVYVEVKSYPIKDESGNIISAIETMNNITEKKKLEEQLRHAQKMEAIGQLAGGIAHDFNNILTAIIGYGNLLHMKMKADEPLRTYADNILASAERATSLTSSLLAFSRKQPINLRPVNLNEVINKIESLLIRVIGEHIDFKTALKAKDLMVMADVGQMEQVLMNFATNARDAMPLGGSLTISTDEIYLDEKFVRLHGYGRHGKYAIISVMDTGEGIDDRIRDKIFEPFFTTKELGKGTGLGLAIAYGIIKQHNGHVNVYSEVGKGTTFRIYLPLTTRAKAVDIKETEKAMPEGGTETILIAEDEEQVRLYTKEVLEEFGYKVIDAVDGEDALRKFAFNRDGINLLLFDVVMPNMNGKKAYDEIKAMSPDIKVLFLSGYPEYFIHKEEILQENLAFVTKPISPRDLLKKVRDVLDS